MYKDWKAENEAKIGVRLGDVKSSGLEHVELPLELSSSSTTTSQSSLVNGGDEAKDAEEEEEEVQQQRQGLHVPVAEEEGRGKRRIQAPNRLTYDALGKPAKSALAGAALMVGEDEESDYEECAFAFFSPVEMPGEPATLKEALESSYAEEWKKAMESELKSIEENGTWELVELPEGRKAITSKWLFKIKSDADGKIERYKSRLVAKGYQQKEKAPRQWYLKLRGVLEEIGFTPSTADHSLFMLGEGEQRSFMVVYVDDILIFSPSSDLVKEVMLKVQDKFKCKALGDVRFYLGLHIERDVEKRCMRVHQRKYLEALAAKFGQSEGHVATPFPSGFKCVKGPEEERVGEEERRRFHSLVGSLMYAAVNTRPDVAFATGQLARVVQCPNEEQVAAGMRVAKYLGQTATVGLQFSAVAQRRQKGADGVEPGRLFLTAFSDASCASEPEDMRSVGGFICCVGGGPTAWESKKQVDQALSSVESEYMALFRAVREIVWQRHLLAELGEEQQGPTPLYRDSQGAIALAKNPVLHGLTKQMRVKWHWTRSMVAAGEVELHYVKTTGQPADMMTKRLPIVTITLSSQDVTFDEPVPYYRLFPYRIAPLPPPPLFLAPGPPPVDPLPPQGPAPSGVSQVDAVEPVEVAVDSGAATGAEPAGAGSGGAESGGAETEGADSGGAETEGAEPGGAEPGGVEPEGAESGGFEPGGAETGGAEPWGAETGGTEPGGTEPGGAGFARVASRGASSRREVLSPQELREWFARRWGCAVGAGGTIAATGSGGTCPGGAGAAGPVGTAEAAEVGPTGVSAGASGGAGAAGSAGTGAAGATRVGAAGGVGASETADAGPSEGAGAGAVGAGGAAGAGAVAERTGAVPTGSGGATRPRPYFVPLLEQVLGLPLSPGPTPPLEFSQPVQSQSPLQPVSPLPAPSPYTGPTGGLAERRVPASRPASPAHLACTSRRTSRPRPPAVPGTHQMTLRPSTAPLRVPLPSPLSSSLPSLANPESDSLRAASPTVTRFLATVVTDPSLASTAASALVAELVDFAAHCRLDYAAGLVAESASVCPPSVGGECAVGTDGLEDRQEEFQCFAALPHLVSTLLAPEGDPNAPDIPTPRSYAEAIEGPYSSQWQAAMDAEMASWKSTGTYVDEVPPPGANISATGS
ncbi:unnamed protein product [Closterium sp. NIES-54]